MSYVHVGDSWTGLQNVKHLMIFGASYCDVGYSAEAPHPTPEHPLGVHFPGRTWCEPGQPNWVGHLVQQSKVGFPDASPLLVYDYARGGDNVGGVRQQVREEFLPHLAPRPPWAPWSAIDSLFLTWVGINDCAVNTRCLDPVAETDASIKNLFVLQEELYASGARHFCFIDVPQTYMFPVRPKSARLQLTVSTWNAKLTEAAQCFASSHPDATVLIWSASALFSHLLTEPETFGFRQEDAADDEGAIFIDGLHPTSAVHEIIAAQLLSFLTEVMPRTAHEVLGSAEKQS